jgi:myo-inositol-hexaphosphate 3-phosphohydrolase
VRLDDDGNGRVKGTQIRILGANNAFVDGIVVDDVLGYVYIAEEDVGIHKHNADPEKNGEQLAFFAREDGIVGRRAGLALYSCTDSTGYILLSNPGSESIKIYRREGEGGDPHRHDLLATIHNANGGDGDGLDVTNYSASASFANGLLMWQNRSENRFDLFAWEDIATTSLTICSRARPTSVEVGLLESPYPGAISLQPNYPNPFNPETKIRFVLNTPKRVLVHVFDLSGKKVRVLLDDVVGPGSHNINWNGRDDSGRPTASGIYFCQLLSDGFSETRPMVLLK